MIAMTEYKVTDLKDQWIFIRNAPMTIYLQMRTYNWRLQKEERTQIVLLLLPLNWWRNLTMLDIIGRSLSISTYIKVIVGKKKCWKWDWERNDWTLTIHAHIANRTYVAADKNASSPFQHMHTACSKTFPNWPRISVTSKQWGDDN